MLDLNLVKLRKSDRSNEMGVSGGREAMGRCCGVTVPGAKRPAATDGGITMPRDY